MFTHKINLSQTIPLLSLPLCFLNEQRSKIAALQAALQAAVNIYKARKVIHMSHKACSH